MMELLDAADSTSEYGCCGPKCCREPERQAAREATRVRAAQGYEKATALLVKAAEAAQANDNDQAKTFVAIADAWHTISYY